MDYKPISGAVKNLLLEKLKKAAETENSNLLEYQKALSETDNHTLIKELTAEAEHWKCEHALSLLLIQTVEAHPEKSDLHYHKNIFNDENVSIWADVTVKKAVK